VFLVILTVQKVLALEQLLFTILFTLKHNTLPSLEHLGLSTQWSNTGKFIPQPLFQLNYATLFRSLGKTTAISYQHHRLCTTDSHFPATMKFWSAGFESRRQLNGGLRAKNSASRGDRFFGLKILLRDLSPGDFRSALGHDDEYFDATLP
jgi:hypothetical protein